MLVDVSCVVLYGRYPCYSHEQMVVMPPNDSELQPCQDTLLWHTKLELDSTKLTIDLFFVDWLERQVQQRRTSEACTDFQRHYLGNKFSSILIILNI